MFDCVVIGAGVVGGLVARELTKYELSVCILEKASDVAMGATRANSAIVHAGYDAKEGTLKAMLNVKGSEMMEGVTSELGVKYENNGSLVIGFNDDDRAVLQELLVRGNKNGVSGCLHEKGLPLRPLLPCPPNAPVSAAYSSRRRTTTLPVPP